MSQSACIRIRHHRQRRRCITGPASTSLLYYESIARRTRSVKSSKEVFSNTTAYVFFLDNTLSYTMTPDEEAKFFAENAHSFPKGTYLDDSDYDLISLVVVDDVSVEVHLVRVSSVSIEGSN